MAAAWRKHLPKLHLIALAGLGFLLYSGNYHNDYQLDTGHMLLENQYVRSLKYLPRYFPDPLTLPADPPNADYRPILQVTFALNYAISGYDQWSWHLVQILLHLAVTGGLYFFCRKLLVMFHPEPESRLRQVAPFLVALVFVVHPAASGVINYLSARSSLLTAAWLLPAFVCYLRAADAGGGRKFPWLSLVFYTLALFTKVEAIGGLGVLFCLEVLLQRRAAADPGRTSPGERGLTADLSRMFQWDVWRRFSPFLGITLLNLLLRELLIPAYAVAARSNVDSYSYFCTQLTAWWFYVRVWLAPVRLVADELTYPVFHSLLAPEVLLALAGLALAGLLLWRLYPRQPLLPFAVAAYLCLLAPTSTFLPLAEMVNEHRPYLPLGFLSMGLLVPAVSWLLKKIDFRSFTGRIWLGWGVLALAALGTLTFARNQVYRTNERYWADVLSKAPSARAYVNYGLELSRKGQTAKAEECFRRSLEIAPDWFIPLVNLGLALETRGDFEGAVKCLDRAVDLETDSAISLTYRGQYLLRRKQYEAAWRDFEQALPKSREFFQLYRGLATAAAGLGRAQDALRHTRRCLELDPVAAENSIVAISTPFWESPDRYAAGVEYYQALDRDLPNRWWIQENIRNLTGRMAGQPQPGR